MRKTRRRYAAVMSWLRKLDMSVTWARPLRLPFRCRSAQALLRRCAGAAQRRGQAAAEGAAVDL